jgi:transposase
MLRKEDFAMIQALLRHGVYQKDIAEEVGVHPKTVSRAIRRGGAPEPRKKARASILDPYHAAIDSLLAEGVWNGMVILREIQAKGYAGSLTILRDYIRPKRVLRLGKATVRFETEPGKQMQNDWGEIVVEIAGVPTKVFFQVNLLGYSRRFHFWCTDSLDAEHTYEGIVRSFAYFGGVAEELLVDNQKSAVLKPASAGKPAQFQERFLDLALWYGFTPRACRPYRARTKGKDERMVSYIKHNFFARCRRFESWAHLNQLAEQWLREEADPRLHGTVEEVVAERFQREQPFLKPLPRTPYDTSYVETRQGSWDGYVDVRGNRYAIPAEFVGKTLTVRIGLDDRLRVFFQDRLVTEHLLRPRSEGWVQVPEYHAPLWPEAMRVDIRPLERYEEAAWN